MGLLGIFSQVNAVVHIKKKKTSNRKRLANRQTCQRATTEYLIISGIFLLQAEARDRIAWFAANVPS